MTVTEIADEVQVQLLFLVQIAQENAVAAMERAAERAQRVLPAAAIRFAGRLPDAGLLDDQEVASGTSTERAIRADSALTAEQKDALLAVYQSYVAANRR